MKYFKKDNEVFAFEADGSQDFLITKDHKPMTADQIDRHLFPEKYLSDGEKYQVYLQSLKALTRRQFRLVLVMNGYDLDEVRAKIAEIPDLMQRQIALIEWEDAATFERLNESLIAMISIIGLTEDEVNTMWEQAINL